MFFFVDFVVGGLIFYEAGVGSVEQGIFSHGLFRSNQFLLKI